MSLKLSEVIALIGAGYTKAEIEAFELMERGKTQSAPQVNTPSEAPKPEAPQPAKPAEQPPQPAKPADNSNAEMLAALKELKEAVQASNRRQSEQPDTGAKSIAEAADKALLEVYNL